jgi:hypothetical protein
MRPSSSKGLSTVLLLTVMGPFGLAIGCGSAPNNYNLPVGSDDGGGSFAGGDASAGAGPLDAFIEQNGVHVTLVTLGCAGDCATVQAVATGGNPPYDYAWDDGSTNPVRSVCPASNVRYSVTATDTATTGEFPHPASTVKVPLEADVFACPEAGPSGADAGDCETILTVTPPSSTVTGPGGMVCSTGSTGSISAFAATVPLAMGQEYEIEEDVTGTLLLGSAPPLWDFYGVSGDCAATSGGELLGSLTFDPGTPHQSFCFTATADHAAIDWTSNAVAAGVGQGVYQLCKGCGRGSTSP